VVPPSSISLSAVARLTGADLRTIQELNPALNRGVAPSGYPVLIPRGTQARFESGYGQLGKAERTVAIAKSRQHKVRRGETASTIARRYGVSVKALLQANRMRSAKVIKAGVVLRIPTSPERPLAGQRVAASPRRPAQEYD
jgi:membrane-bound lytic murein transglycosylase D